MDYILILYFYQELPLGSVQRHEVLKVLRIPRSTWEPPFALLLLWLGNKVILPSPLLIYLILLYLFGKMPRFSLEKAQIHVQTT